MTEQYVHLDISQNFRMSEIEAAWLRLQLPHLHEDNRRRAEIARHYHAAAPHVQWQADHPRHVYHLCVARFTDRDAARAELAAQGVATAVHYPLSIGRQPAFRDLIDRTLPRGRSLGGAVRQPPVLSRADRCRGRNRRSRPR